MSKQGWNYAYSTSKQLQPGPLFVCHTATDKAFVEKLCKDLKEATGCAVFFSGEFGGEAFKANTSLKVVATCSLGILVLSHEFFTASKWPMIQLVAMLSSRPTKNSILPVYFKINISQFKNYKSLQPIWFEKWEQWAKEDSHINVETWKVAVAQIEDYTGVHALYQQSKQLNDHNVREQIVANVLKNGFSFPGFIPRSTTSSLPSVVVPEVARVNPGYYQQTFQQTWPQQQYNFQPPQVQPQAYMQQQPRILTYVPTCQAPQVPQVNENWSKHNSLEGCNYYYDGSCGGIRWKKQEDLTSPYYKGESSQGAMKKSTTGTTKDDSDNDEGNVNKYLVESHDENDDHHGDVSENEEEDEEVIEEDNSNSDKDGDGDEDEDGDGDDGEDGNGDGDGEEDGNGDDDEDGNGDGDGTDSDSGADYSG